jgi:hypothetical protein
VRDPVILLTVFGTAPAGMAASKIMSLAVAQRVAQSVQAQCRLGTHLIEIFDAVGMQAPAQAANQYFGDIRAGPPVTNSCAGSRIGSAEETTATSTPRWTCPGISDIAGPRSALE